MRLRHFCIIPSRTRIASLILLTLATLLHAQTPPAPSPPADQPAYTLHTSTRLVLTDVTVTDRAGNPVHNLPATAFHILDGKTPQDISSFEEHTAADNAEQTPTVATTDIARPKGVYSNDFLRHAPPVLNIIVLDLTTIQMEDQMYLSYELGQFLKSFPAGQPLAMYERDGPITVLLQNFTTDRNLLLAAVHKGLPRFPPRGAFYLNDLDTLSQLSTYLSDLPGRKNLLWFSSGSSLFLQPDATQFQDIAAVRRVYDSLEANRIAVYPIDARGLTVGSVFGMVGQHVLMSEVAEATGGHAFYNTNGLKEAVQKVTATGGDFYSLTYSPHGYKEDKKWHKVRITLDGEPYNLSYRRGYFADGFNAKAPQSGRSLTHLFASGSTGTDQAAANTAPIVFQARVLPVSGSDISPLLPNTPGPNQKAPPKPKRGAIPYGIRYTVSADDLTISPAPDGKHTIQIVVAAFAYNDYGSVVDQHVQRMILTLNEESLRLHPHAEVPLDLQLQLAKGEIYLMLAVVDEASGRSGNLQIAMDVPAPPKPVK